MKILVAATGGTIGSAAKDGVISTDKGQTLLLLELFRNAYGNVAEFQVETLCSVLSENADDTFYETLCGFLKTVNSRDCDGVILLHGTDTLSFSAALCAMAVREVTKSVCFVSSNHVLTEKNANGLANFYAAVRYIEAGLSGFVVPYRNSDGQTQFHLATRLLEADAFLDDFRSAGDCPLAWFKDDKIICNSAPCVPAQSLLQEKRTPVFNEAILFSKKILPLKMYPVLDFAAITPNSKTCAAVLLLGYHSGTAPEKAVEAFAASCFDAGIPVYLAPVKRGEDVYASADTLFKCKVIPLYNMTPESALAKLKIAYNHPTKPAAEILKETLYFEDTGVFLPQSE